MSEWVQGWVGEWVIECISEPLGRQTDPGVEVLIVSWVCDLCSGKQGRAQCLLPVCACSARVVAPQVYLGVEQSLCLRPGGEGGVRSASVGG